MSDRFSTRAFGEKFGWEAEFAIFPGENPFEFDTLNRQLAEELTPDGPIQEDLVFTIAKGFWRKRRHQRFSAARALSARLDPSHAAYDERLALDGFCRVIAGLTQDFAVRQALRTLGGYFAEYLNTIRPRKNFRNTRAWIAALQKEVEQVLMPWVAGFGTKGSDLEMWATSAILTDDLFARELEFEERIDSAIAQALDRLAKEKAAKPQRSFRDRQRFDRSRPIRSSDVKK